MDQMTKNLGSFCYQRRVAYCDTDAMGVVHHANYLRYFEEARVAWLRERGLRAYHAPCADLTLAVLKSECEHFHPAFFDDLLNIRVQVRSERLKIHFRYAIFSESYDNLICLGYTQLVPVNGEFKICRLPREFKETLEKESWTETWP